MFNILTLESGGSQEYLYQPGKSCSLGKKEEN